jgi:hypothetical protein
LASLQGVQAYIYSLGVQRERLDQTDLRNGVDAILGDGGGTFWKLLISRLHREPGGMVVGPAGPTWHPLGVYYGVVSSGTFLSSFRRS